MTSSLDSVYKKMASTSEGGTPRLAEPAYDPDKHVPLPIAHELNNILAIVQGYADRLLLKHADNAVLCAELKMIAEAARRAAAIIRDATPQALNHLPQHVPEPAPFQA
jgi:hypothetical protein